YSSEAMGVGWALRKAELQRAKVAFRMGMCGPLPTCFTRVPLCFGGGRTDPEFDKWLQPHRRQQQRTMIEEDMEILCHGDKGEFTVANLTYRFNQEVQLCLLHHPPSASDAEMKWSVEKLQIPPNMKINLYSFKTDAVVIIGE
ncbi:hypothetical protein ACJX0J_035548, partial [Zea mays]